MKWKIINKVLAVEVLVLNLACFYWLTVYIIYTTGGPMGFGLLVLPISIIANLFSIPAILILVKKVDTHTDNALVKVGAVWCLVWFVFIVINKIF